MWGEDTVRLGSVRVPSPEVFLFTQAKVPRSIQFEACVVYSSYSLDMACPLLRRRSCDPFLFSQATSALDVQSERAVQQALDEVMQSRTTVTVAHRLSTVQRVDSIAVLRTGRVVEQGTHSSLIREKGEYFELVNMQVQ